MGNIMTYLDDETIRLRLQETVDQMTQLDIDQEAADQGLFFTGEPEVSDVLDECARLGVTATPREAFALWSYVSCSVDANWLITNSTCPPYFWFELFARVHFPYDPGPGPVRDGEVSLADIKRDIMNKEKPKPPLIPTDAPTQYMLMRWGPCNEADDQDEWLTRLGMVVDAYSFLTELQQTHDTP